MVSTKSILLASACALTASATPIRRATAVTADMLLQIDASMASCAPANTECATAAQAAPALNNAFAKYNIADANTQAALVAYMYFESVHFVYNTNQGGNVGQGTRMMAKPNYVAEYAAVAADPTALKAAGDNATAILETVNASNDLSFGAGAWFLTSQCSDAVKTGLAAGTMDGWHNFLTACVSTSLDSARDTPYQAALKAFAGAPSAPANSAVAVASSAPSQAQPSAPSVPAPATPSAAPSQAAPAKPSSSPAAPAKPSASPVQSAKASPSQAQPTAAYSAVMPAPATPSGTDVASPSSPSGNGSNTCSNNGAVVCNGEKQFGLCNNGYVVWQDVAAGTACANGFISKRSFNGRIASPRV